MITKDNVAVHGFKTKTKTGKNILKLYAAVDGFCVKKFVGFQSKKNPNQWVVSEDCDDEDKKLFTFFENEIKEGESFALKAPEFSIFGLNFPLFGWLGYKYPKYDTWGNELFTCNMSFDESQHEYYTGEGANPKYPKNYVLENPDITFDKSELEILEKNSYKEFIDLKNTIFKGRVYEETSKEDNAEVPF